MDALERVSLIRSQMDALEKDIKALIAQGGGGGIVEPPPITPPAAAYRRSAGVDRLRVSVIPAVATTGYWKLIDMWTTNFGSWEMSGDPYSLPGWARNDYMARFPLAGGDHNIYAMLLDHGAPRVNHSVQFWHDHGVFFKPTNDKGFCEQDVFGSFDPGDPAQRGAWSAKPSGNADQMSGFGLPMNHHVSLFCVWAWVG